MHLTPHVCHVPSTLYKFNIMMCNFMLNYAFQNMKFHVAAALLSHLLMGTFI